MARSTYCTKPVDHRCTPPYEASLVNEHISKKQSTLTAEFQAATPPQLEDPDGVDDGADELEVGPELPETVVEVEIVPMLLRILSHLLVG